MKAVRGHIGTDIIDPRGICRDDYWGQAHRTRAFGDSGVKRMTASLQYQGQRKIQVVIPRKQVQNMSFCAMPKLAFGVKFHTVTNQQVTFAR